MTLGNKLKKLRTNAGLTQKDLADQLHVSFQTVSKWENDENEPDIATLRELAKLYNCSIDYLVNEEEEPKQEEPNKEEVPQAPTTIIIHQKELHVCERCKKDIPEDELDFENITKSEKYGRSGHRDVVIGQRYYHKSCLEQVKREREAVAARIREEKTSKAKKLSFGWGIAGGVVALGISLAIFLCNMQYVHPALGVLFSILIGYGIFAMLYCIISGSYIGDVFVWCATLSIKFPGLIFSWDIEGFIWVITMKILFAILGFLIGLFALAFAIVFSASLGAISFPFVLIHNINNNYADAL